MKARFPLSLKILAWLALNLGLIVVIGAAVLFGPGGFRTALEETVLERLQLIADQIAYEFRSSDDYEEIVSRYAERYDLKLTVYANQDGRLAGFTEELPPMIKERLRPRGELRGEPITQGEFRRPPPGAGRPSEGRLLPPPEQRRRQPPPLEPPDGAQGDPRRPPEPRWTRGEPGGELTPPRPRSVLDDPNAPDRPAGAFIDREEDPGRWWIGIRIPVPRPGDRTAGPGTLLAVSDSFWAFGSVLDLRPVLIGMGVVVVVSILFWLPLVLRMTHALKSMMRATGEIAEGRFETRVATTRLDEIGTLGHSINRMAGRLDSLVNSQKKFLADIAHELGSPVGRLQVASSILEERVADDLKPRVADVREEVEQMSDLLGELLAFTKLGLQAREAHMQPVVLGDAITQAVDREGQGADLERNEEDNLVVLGDAKLLVKVLGNLVRNAVRYGGDRVHVAVEAHRQSANEVQLQIRDDGPGVPEGALDRLGEPFFRPDEARTRRAGGTGLGLSIVRESIAAMQGRVSFANAKPHGFEVTIVLPAADLGEFTPA